MNGYNDILSGINARLGNAPLKTARKELLFSELLSLLSSGLDFSYSFRLLISSEEDKATKALLQRLYDDVVAGKSLSMSLEDSGRFSALDCGVVRIGEETGRLHESLEFLTDYYRKKSAHARMVSSAVSYPIIIMCVAVAVVIFMLTVIVPMFEQVYSRMGGELPALTRWIISVSGKLPAILGVLLLITVAVAVVMYVFRKSDNLRRIKASLVLRTPLAGQIVKKNYQSHFCKLLYLLTVSGIPLLRAVKMLEQIITFYPYQMSFSSIAHELQGGRQFTVSLERYPELYERKLTALLRVGEETNRLPQMLRHQGEELSSQLEHRLKQIGNLLEPLMIMLVGVLVAVILISMYMPMFRLGGLMG